MHITKPHGGRDFGARDISMHHEAGNQPPYRQRSRESSGSEGPGTRPHEYDSRIFRRHSGNKQVQFEDEVKAQQNLQHQHNRDAGHPYKRPQRRSGDRTDENDFPFQGFNQNFDGNRNNPRNRGGFGNPEQRDRRDNYRDIRQYRHEHDDRGGNQNERQFTQRNVQIKQGNEHDHRAFDQNERRDNNRDGRFNQRNDQDRRGNYRDRQNQRNNNNERYGRQDSWGNNRDNRQQQNEQEARSFVRSNSFGGGDRLSRSNSNQGDEKVARSKSFRGNEGRNRDRNDENAAPQHDGGRNQETGNYVSLHEIRWVIYHVI